MKCKATTKSGSPCLANAVTDSDFCFTHDPTRTRERAAAHKRGGRRSRVPHSSNGSELPKAIRTSGDIMALLDYTLRELVIHDNSIARARALIATANAYAEVLRLAVVEEELRSQGARLAAIEAVLAARGSKK